MILAAALVLAAAGFVAACARLPGGGGARPWWFLAGIAALAVALVSPVHGWSERSLAGHMVQHVLLISLAAPLLAAAHPFEAVARSGRRQHSPWPSSRRSHLVGPCPCDRVVFTAGTTSGCT